MPSEDSKILEFNQNLKIDKTLSIIYVAFLIVNIKLDGCKSNPKKSSTSKVVEHIASDFSMPTISSFKDIKNSYHVFKGKDCIIKFSEYLKKHTREIIDFRK